MAGTFDKLGKVLPRGAELYLENLLVKDDQAVVELHSLATAKMACVLTIVTAGFALLKTTVAVQPGASAPLIAPL